MRHNFLLMQIQNKPKLMSSGVFYLMKNKFSIIILIVFIAVSISVKAGAVEQVDKLDNLVYKNNPVLQSIREDIKQTIYTVKSRTG